jgi:hypothetical protein
MFGISYGELLLILGATAALIGTASSFPSLSIAAVISLSRLFLRFCMIRVPSFILYQNIDESFFKRKKYIYRVLFNTIYFGQQ